MENELILCDHCDKKKPTLVCKECFQGMWCSEECRAADAADHHEYICYHPDDLSDECVLDEVDYETHDPTEARQIMKEMIGEDIMSIDAEASRARRKAKRRRRRRARKERLRRRRQRLKAKRGARKEKRDLRRETAEDRRYARELRRGTREETRAEKAERELEEARQAAETYDTDMVLEEAHIASFFV